MFDNTGKNRPKSFHHWKDCLFFETCVLNNLLVPKKRSFTFHSNCQISLWILTNCSSIFLTLDGTRKKGPKTFVIVKLALLWIVCFYRPLRFQGSNHLHKYCQNTLWLLIKSSMTFSCFVKREKIGQNLFFTRKIAFFSQLSVFNNLPGKRKCSNKYRSKCQKKFVDP